MQVGPYEVVQEVARGGQGVLYRARDAQGRAVALKLLLETHTPTTRRRFVREARTMQLLEHPHVARCYAAGEHEGKPWLALEFVEGRSLDDRLNHEGPLPLQEVRRVALALCDALEAVHARGLLHRDLKPANVLENVAGRIVLTDFGLVKQDPDGRQSTQSLTVEGGVLGTPGFWPPEQAQGQLEEIGEHSDVYGLGATLYALLTGEPPRGGANFAELVRAMLAPPPRLQRARPDAPLAWERILTRTLETEIDDRPTLAELRAAFAPAVGARPAPHDRPSLALPAALGAAVLALGLGLTWFLWPTEPTPAVEPPGPGPLAPEPKPTAPVLEGVAATAPERVLAARGGHLGTVRALAVDAEGAILSGGSAGTLRLWSPAGDLEATWRYAEQVGALCDVAFAPGQRRYALGLEGTLVRVDPSGRPTLQPTGHPRGAALDASALGELVTAGSDGLRRWTAAEAQGDAPPPPLAVQRELSVAGFAPDGSGFAAGPGGAFRWAAGGEVASVTRVGAAPYSDLAWSPDGKALALVAEGYSLRLYSWPGLDALGRTRVADSPRARSAGLCFSADGRQVFTGGVAHELRAWNVPDLTRARGLPTGSSKAAWQIARDPAGGLIAGGAGAVLLHVSSSGSSRWAPAVIPAVVDGPGGPVPTHAGLAWLTPGESLLLNSREGIKHLNLDTGKLSTVSGPLPAATGIWANDGILFALTPQALIGSEIRLGPAGPELTKLTRVFEIEPPAQLWDLQLEGWTVFVSATLERDPPRAAVYVQDMVDSSRDQRLGPFRLKGWPQLGAWHPDSKVVWVAGDEDLVSLAREGGKVRRMPLGQRAAIVAQTEPRVSLLVTRDGSWQWGEFGKPEGVLGGDLPSNQDGSQVALLGGHLVDRQQVLLNWGSRVGTLDYTTGDLNLARPLPPLDPAASLLLTPEKDAVFVWTARGELWRYPLE